jgi:hypothetical protein
MLALASAVPLGSESRRTHDRRLPSHLRLPQPGGLDPRIYIPQKQGVPDIPSGTVFLFVASYKSHVYGAGILTRLRTDFIVTLDWLSFYRLCTDLIENTASDSSSIVTFVYQLQRKRA